jgi:hypothetical protein
MTMLTEAPDIDSLYWKSMNPYDLLGVKQGNLGLSVEQLFDQAPGIARSSGPASGVGQEPPWSVHNPLFWFGVLAAATFGLIAGSTSIGVRVGPAAAAAGVSLGKKGKR